MDKIPPERQNQTQFTFLIFDRASVEKFSSDFTIDDLRELTLLADFDSLKRKESSFSEYSDNTALIDSTNVSLAKSILSSVQSGDAKYAGAARSYFLFSKWLPEQFKYKWVQTEGGHFEFEANFFANLRDESSELDKLIYGEKGFWPKEWKALLDGHIYNELNKESAVRIKKTLAESDKLKGPQYHRDKEILLAFLDKVISGDWRMVLLDWG
ncbi:hypothetical protein [Paracnuella aquatica]|uniref:hypothetical protein n=1 Tax=Paracnuella aquatica TaxID=2268757 RepID=UPI000DEED663|nr:hypothetical protein [Paracnuella aquatica]RPD43403.1 hypothetical protein DRJ53_20340 [Paracnuella aquatica]